MDPARWQRVKGLFESALEQHDPDTRDAYLRDACRDDRTLFDEVESLLSEHFSYGGLLDDAPSSLFDLDEELTPRADVPLRATSLGRYAVLDKIGRGGMSTVYSAYDPTLDRQVALKVLAQTLAFDPDYVGRFFAEAKAIAAIRHPHIVAVYEIGEHDGVYFMAQELLDGETLAERLARERLSAEQVLGVVRQVASALQAAHQAGVVHRDIKPSNVMLSATGHVTVLDFGLAKAVGRLSSAAHTISGVLLGTVNYMSPEQAAMTPVDYRSDLFSLGVVLWEMLHGRAPFCGDTPAHILDAIRRTPVRPQFGRSDGLALRLEQVALRCLEKSPSRRYESAAALIEALDAGGDGVGRLRVPIVPMMRAHGARLLAALRDRPGAGVAIMVGVASLALFYVGATNEARPPSVSSVTKVTDEPGPELFPSIAPDGRSICFAARHNGNWDIFEQDLVTGQRVNLTAGCERTDTQPSYSPHGDAIVFRSDCEEGIVVLDRTDLSRRRVSAGGYNPRFSPDGSEIVFATVSTVNPRGRRPGELRVVSVEDGRVRTVVPPDATQPTWSPSGARLAYWGVRRGAGARELWTVGRDGRGATLVASDGHMNWNPLWSPDGEGLLYLSDREGGMRVWYVEVDETRGHVASTPVRIGVPAASVAHASLSADGRRLAYVEQLSQSNIYRYRFDRDREQVFGEAEPVTRGSKNVTSVDVSPDGSMLAFIDRRNGHEDLFVMPASGGATRRLTNDGYKDRQPRWSPSGAHIALYSDRSGSYEVWRVDVQSGVPERVTDTPDVTTAYPAWSPDGQRMAFMARGRGNVIVDLREPTPIAEFESLPTPPFRSFVARSWSPDGRFIGGSARLVPNDGYRNLAVYDLERNAYEIVATDVDDSTSAWLQDGRRLLAPAGSELLLVDIVTKQVHRLLSVAPDRIDAVAISRDEQSIYIVRQTFEADIWLAELE